jgi:hypothetical protein
VVAGATPALCRFPNRERDLRLIPIAEPRFSRRIRASPEEIDMPKTSWVVVLLVLSSASVVLGQARTRRPNVDVKRAGAGTPEITGLSPKSIENGKETEIVVKGREFPPDAKLEATRECRLIRSKLISAMEASFTVISTSEKGGWCGLGIVGKVKHADEVVEVKPTAAYQVILDKKKEEDKKAQAVRQAKDEEETKARLDYATKTAPELVGKSWSVTLPNGKSETWTLSSKSTSGGKFTSPTGKQITVIVQPGDKVMVMPGEAGCIFEGTLKNGKVTDGKQDMPATMCKLGQGKWSATVSK